MDSLKLPSQPLICPKHSLPITVVNSNPKIGLCCSICLQQMPDNVPIEQFNQQQQEMDLDLQQFQQLLQELLKYKENIICGLDKIIQIILEQKNSIMNSKMKVNSIIESYFDKETAIKDIQEIANKQKQINKDVKDQAEKQLTSFLEKYLDKEKQFKHLQCDLVRDTTVKQENNCYSFAFNNDNTLLFVGCKDQIIVYEFINGKIGKESQRLKNHTLSVNCLFYMKKLNSLVSGGGDSAIIIWILNQDNKWVAKQTLSEHTSYVSSIMMNKMEDYLISVLESDEWKLEMLTKYCARNMSLNKMEDKLIVCENNYQSFSKMSCIEVLMQNNDKSQQGIVQTFKFDNLGWRLCFTIGDQFAFATQKSDFLEIYNYDTIQKEFQMVWQFKINNIRDCCNGFPCQYIESLHILTFKHGDSLKIIKVNDNYSYELMNEVQFSCNEIYGRMSDDGKYIVTWEKTIREIQIRKIQYLE